MARPLRLLVPEAKARAESEAGDVDAVTKQAQEAANLRGAEDAAKAKDKEALPSNNINQPKEQVTTAPRLLRNPRNSSPPPPPPLRERPTVTMSRPRSASSVLAQLFISLSRLATTGLVTSALCA